MAYRVRVRLNAQRVQGFDGRIDDGTVYVVKGTLAYEVNGCHSKLKQIRKRVLPG